MVLVVLIALDAERRTFAQLSGPFYDAFAVRACDRFCGGGLFQKYITTVQKSVNSTEQQRAADAAKNKKMASKEVCAATGSKQQQWHCLVCAVVFMLHFRHGWHSAVSGNAESKLGIARW